MSMTDPLQPQAQGDRTEVAAAEPGPHAPGTPMAEEPDILPGPAVEEEEIPTIDSPFRTPAPGDKLTADEVEARLPE